MAYQDRDARTSLAKARVSRDTMEKHGQHIDLDDVDGLEPSPETYATIMATNKPDPRGPGYIKLYTLAVLLFLCSTFNGFDSSLMGSINALPNYTEYFGLPSNGNASTGIVFAIFQVGQMSAALFIWMTDWYGRTWHIFFGCVGVCIGTIITALSTNLTMFIGGRFLLSFFATCAQTASPLYLVEIAPAAYRGTIAGAYNTFYNVGSILATSSVYACHLHLADHGDLDWRIPLWLQMVCPAILACFIKFFPESPRFLVANDQHEKAKEIITKYHANGDPDHPLVTLEMKEMLGSVQGSQKATWKDILDLRVLVESRSSRYRLMLNVAFSWFGQFSGNNIISYYLPLMLDGIGITDTNTKLILNIIYSVIGWVFSLAGARLHDVVGRRKMLIGSTLGMTICLAFVAAGAAGKVVYGNSAAATMSIAFIFIFGAIFAAGYTPMQPIYPAEVVSNKMRAKAMGTFKLTAGAAGFLNTFVGPIALSSVGYWFYVFFVFWDTFEMTFMYFFFVETKGMTLEELDTIFEAKNPRKASIEAKKMQKKIIKGEGISEGVTV
ncbi:general substrate transporter [Annulohypoxylon bovei var. microspora]|nr:general substrate transporter [Annulohypoxylon bovei var. microspora]